VVGEDLDGGGGACRGGADARREPRRRVRSERVREWHGPQRWRRCSVKAHAEELLSVRHRL
jgi:hypothetical protein